MITAFGVLALMAGRYMQQTGNTLMVRVTGFKQKNFHISMQEQAIAYRDALCRLAGLDPAVPFSHKSGRTHIKPNKTKSSPLPVGISIDTSKKALANGGIATYTCVRASVTINGKSSYKSFSADRLGFDAALQKAVEWRAEHLEVKAALLTELQRQRQQQSILVSTELKIT